MKYDGANFCWIVITHVIPEMARHYADLRLPGTGTGALVFYNRRRTVVAKRTDTYVIPRVAAHQQRAGRIRDGNAVEWILRTGRPVESPSFLYDRRSHCGCRKLVDSLARSGILGNPGSPFRGWNVHGGRVPRGHENGSELGRERYGITCGFACGRVDD